MNWPDRHMHIAGKKNNKDDHEPNSRVYYRDGKDEPERKISRMYVHTKGFDF